jgi:CheY-like chemotaxis protein
MLNLTLAQMGFTVTTVARANQALDLLENATFDLNLVDLVMPEMGGQEYFQALLKRNPALARCVIFMTGAAIDSPTQRFIANTGRPLLTKPFSLDELEKAIAAETAPEGGAGAVEPSET